eukprot:CAMPEP_0183303002 /NCGR_PEP_ID=MMETSP0160_2-20130417/8603_1 /TAXON_ID=2839 ORGANISM="Odontella Sinensis, Strain Grunow 1884" /NCGR_SAMPLE_ID=MMETSP0160_2 /ASSEMBLY_ACC=CAM_ASM_000250 /LENGTH=509 /DNA_ID=CAMNT_0025465855 /DNA_START=126 /DNA_END=1655 /DNA_ORIENTATION=+
MSTHGNLDTPGVMNDLGTFYHELDPSFAWRCYEKSLRQQMETVLDCMQILPQTTDISSEAATFTSNDALATIQLLEKATLRLGLCLGNENDNQITCPEMESSLIGMKACLKPIETRPDNKEMNAFNYDKISAITILNISVLALRRHRFEDAVELLEISLELIRRAACAGASCPLLSEMTMMAITNLGYVSYRSGEYEKSVFYFENTVKHIRETIEDVRCHGNSLSMINSKVSQFISAFLNLARSYDASGRHGEAMAVVLEAELLANALELSSQSSSGGASLDVTGLSYVKAVIYLHQEEHDQSLAMFQMLCGTHWEHLSLGHRSAILHGMGQVLFEKRHLREAMMHLQTALTMRQKVLQENHSDVLETFYTMARILHDREEYTDALEVYKKVLKGQRETPGTEHHRTLKTLCNIARVHQARGESTESLQVCTEAIQLGEVMLGPKHTFVVEMLIMQGALLHELGRVEAAMAILKKVAKIIDSPNLKAEDFLSNLGHACGYSTISCASAA